VNAALLAHLDPAGTLAEKGERVRREVMGDAYVDRVLGGASAFGAPLQEYFTTLWGAVWARPGLGRRERSMLTVALLAAAGHERELAMHILAARTNGVTEAELVEVLLQAGVYAGAPVARRAFAVAEEVLRGTDPA
jgi:alkylhydroperoxidase/carboxymuconolactone decarboxylase family protein YurZ